MTVWEGVNKRASDLWAWLRAWARRPGRVVLSMFGGLLVGLGVAFVMPNSYTVSMSVMPEAETGGSQLRTLAGALGPLSGAAFQALGRGGETLTPEFIARAALSDTVLLAVARAREGLGDSAIYQALRRGGRSHSDSVMRAVKYLRRKIIMAEPDRRTPIVSIAVETRDSLLSTVIGQRLLEALDGVLIINRRTAVSSERQFLQERYDTARQDLRLAEDAMRGFLERNRSYEQSPALRFEYGRLERRITLAQEVFVTIARQLQVTEADEVRSTPVLNVLESPRPPTRADSRHAVLIAVACSCVVLAIALLVQLAGRIVTDSAPMQEARGK